MKKTKQRIMLITKSFPAPFLMKTATGGMNMARMISRILIGFVCSPRRHIGQGLILIFVPDYEDFIDEYPRACLLFRRHDE